MGCTTSKPSKKDATTSNKNPDQKAEMYQADEENNK